MTPSQKAELVLNCLKNLGVRGLEKLEAVCDENLERSYQVITENPQITKAEFLEKMQITEE